MAASRARSCPPTWWWARTPIWWPTSSTSTRARRSKRLLDLRAVREDPARFRAALARRSAEAAAALDEALELDARRRELLPELEQIRAAKNQASKRIGELARAGEDISEAKAEAAADSEREKRLEAELAEVEERLARVLTSIPNPPADSAPDEEEVIREVGQAGSTGHDHLELLDGLVD